MNGGRSPAVPWVTRSLSSSTPGMWKSWLKRYAPDRRLYVAFRCLAPKSDDWSSRTSPSMTYRSLMSKVETRKASRALMISVFESGMIVPPADVNSGTLGTVSAEELTLVKMFVWSSYRPASFVVLCSQLVSCFVEVRDRLRLYARSLVF